MNDDKFRWSELASVYYSPTKCEICACLKCQVLDNSYRILPVMKTNFNYGSELGHISLNDFISAVADVDIILFSKKLLTMQGV